MKELMRECCFSISLIQNFFPKTCPILIFDMNDLKLSACNASLEDADKIEVKIGNSLIILLQCKKCGSKIFFSQEGEDVLAESLLISSDLDQTCPYCDYKNQRLVFDLKTSEGFEKVVFCNECNQPFIPF